jgi:aryl-alcohol dehydrogenase-like predicted oxidoreductase
VAVLDTAPLYGASEEVLGLALRPGHSFRIVTKTPKFQGPSITETEAGVLIASFLRSLDLLEASSIHGLMAHDADDLLKPGGEYLFAAMEDLRSRGLVARVGASVYTGSQIDALRGRYRLGIVQAPVNVLDQRLLRGGQLRALKSDGCEVHARSAFLQGALLMDPSELPRHFDPARAHPRAFRERIESLGLSPLAAALGFVAGLPEVDVVVCGINNRTQLAELGPLAVPLAADLSAFAIADEAILNPSRWSK